MKDRIKELNSLLKSKISLTKEEWLSILSETDEMLNNLGDLRGKEFKPEVSRIKTRLWSIRCSIRYRINTGRFVKDEDTK